MSAQIKQFAIYSRKSKFTGKGESIENQIEMCKKYISDNYGKEFADNACVYEDEGFSGKNLKRPQFQKMLKESKEGKFDAIVVYRLDRISRNVGDFAKLIEDLVNRNIAFISTKEKDFDGSTAMNRAMLHIASAFAELERETIAERIRDNMHELAKSGRWLGGTTPTGFESESILHESANGKTHTSCILKPIPEEIVIVKLIFDKFIETNALSQTEQFLMNNGYTTKTGKRFSRFAIRAILTNPVYCVADEDMYNYLTQNDADLFSEKSAFDGVHAIMAYNKTKQQQGNANKVKPLSEWIVAVGKHEGIISGAKWVQVQNMLDLNKSKSYRKPRSNIALLSGVLRCAECGDYMRPKMSGRLTADGEPSFVYLCSTKEKSKSHLCHVKNVNGNKIDAEVIKAIKDSQKTNSDASSRIASLKKQLSSANDNYEEEKVVIKDKIKANDNEINLRVDKFIKVQDAFIEERIKAQITELRTENERLNSRLEELDALTQQNNLSALEFDVISKKLSSVSNSIDDYTVDEKRKLIKSVIKEVRWDGKEAHIYRLDADGECDLSGIQDMQHIEPLGEDSK
ncbi:MAG: recombinase family protein [Clostridia bacterium]|nr:recombinase family protein [Clostridia bacterium]